MTTRAPDLFTNVHKGIRKALFDACTALGRAGTDVARDAVARTLVRDALRFVTHHGENEDLLLIPLVRMRNPTLAARMESAHRLLDERLTTLTAELTTASTDVLYERACSFLSLYLEHMREEEQALDPLIRETLSADELSSFGKKSVERTSPSDQRMMLGWMLPAMTRDDVEEFLAKVPADIAASLRPLAM